MNRTDNIQAILDLSARSWPDVQNKILKAALIRIVSDSSLRSLAEEFGIEEKEVRS